MDMAAGRQHSESRAIPGRQPPQEHCSPRGDALFSTSPGDTRIIYDRKFLLDRRNSPVAQTPPARLPVIPGVTSPSFIGENRNNEANYMNNHNGDDAQFEIDM